MVGRGGGGDLHICVYSIYRRTRDVPQACVFNDIKNHTNACCMHIRVPFRIVMKKGQWQSIVVL